jgi:glycosyl transferase family 8
LEVHYGSVSRPDNCYISNGLFDNAQASRHDGRMKTIIVTGADENFSGLLLGLIDSLHQWDQPLADAIGVLDLGLAKETLRKICGRVTRFATPGWDLPVGPDARQSKPFLRAMTARSFLPRYFPGYDQYLWLDADTWVQERYVTERFFQHAKGGAMAVVPEADHSYIHTADIINWRTLRLSEYFGEDATLLLPTHTYYNSGAVCLEANAPHWESWTHRFRQGLTASPELVSDQTALNYAIWQDKLPLNPLPALCNWCCHLADVVVDRRTGKLCKPGIPRNSIGLIHMTSSAKDKVLHFDLGGKKVTGNLHFGGLSSVMAAARSQPAGR